MKYLSVFFTFLVVIDVSVTPDLLAQGHANHIVSVDQLRTRLVGVSAERAANIEEVQKLLSHETIRAQVGALADLDKIEAKVSTLDNHTLAQLAEQGRTINDQLQAGVSNVGWIAIIVISITVIIVVS